MIIEQIKKFKGPLLLLLVLFIAYLPLSSFLFALKNDAFIYNFPNKHFFSEALRHGYLPTWNPYLNFGFPLYADPGFAWWHPITWLFGIIGYNAFTFTIEILLYIYIAGFGMYYLGRKLNFQKKTSFLMGCMFMCCGFFIGNLQHINFLTCAAFLPWLVSFWLLCQQIPNVKNLVGFNISGYLLCTGGHPAIPIGTLFFGCSLIILYPFFFLPYNKLKNYILLNCKLIILIILFLSPLLFSYFILFPYYSRSGAVNHFESALVGFTFPSYISFLLPFSTLKNSNFFLTDVSMRNAYFSLLGLFSFVLFLINDGKTNLQKLFCIAGLIMLILSLGGNAKEIIYTHLPLLKSIRTNGEFRVFAIFSFILCSSFEINQIFSAKYAYKEKLKLLFKGLSILCLFGAILITVLLNSILNLSISRIAVTQVIKQGIENITFEHTFLISLLVASFLSFIYWWAIYRNNWKNILLIAFLLDVCLNSWLLLPITGVGKASVFKMQQIISKSPKGFPYPISKFHNNSLGITKEEKTLLGNWSWYDKQIVHSKIDYPSQLNGTELYYQNGDTVLVNEKKFAFLKNNPNENIEILHFTPNSFTLKLNVSKLDTLIILQNYFPGWKAYSYDKRVPIFPYYGIFIATTVNRNTRKVIFHFKPFN